MGNRIRALFRLSLLVLLAIGSLSAVAQSGRAFQVQIHSDAIEGNLGGDSALRDVSIYLPPSYASAPERRYPVVYWLHGSGGDHMSQFADGARTHIPTIADRTIAAGQVREMIIVSPSGRTIYGGSNYSSGVTTGDFERFIASELVNYMDTHYRTIPSREGRGLAGHSMGGYGTWRIGMKHADVFSAIYVMSSCCISAGSNLSTNPEVVSLFESWYQSATSTPTSVDQVPGPIRTSVQAAAAWAPNPEKPPLYFDLPFQDGEQVRAVVDRMTTNRPLVMVDQYINELRTQALAFDVGDKDVGIAANLTEMSRILTVYQVPHSFEIYEGTHGSGVPMRFENNVLPFFSAHLQFSGQ